MFTKKAAGIYIGPQGLSVVEFSGIKIKNYIFSPYPQDITSPAGSLAPRDSIFKAFLDNEVEILAFIQRSIRESRVDIDNDTIVISVPTRDLIVRFFELPPIPRKDIQATVGFEIKKYIPFKIEEIAYDYQIHSTQKIIEVLFAGIKNEDLDKYDAIITQSKMKVAAIEPSQFSLLRLLKAKRVISENESVVVVELGREEGAISIIDSGIPCFSRDIKLPASSEPGTDMETVFFRIINEVRVSIDYFRRQFLKKAIERIIVLSKEESTQLLATFNKELSIPVVYRSPDKLSGITDPYSLDLAKALGASLRISKPSALTINLARKERPAPLIASQQMVSDIVSGLLDIPRSLMIKAIALAVFVLAGIFFFGQRQLQPLTGQLQAVSRNAQSELAGPLAGLDVSALQSLRDTAREKLSQTRSVFTRDYTLAEKLDSLSKLMPEGVWFEEITFDREGRGLHFKGIVYRQDDSAAAEAPYQLVANLNNSPQFSNKVANIEVKNLATDSQNNYKVVRFDVIITMSN